jgi:hydrocephalus-inducing protein
MHAFKHDIHYKIVRNQEKRKLLTVNGAAFGIELKLMEDTVGFGTVVVNSTTSKQVQLANLGDIGARFAWQTDFCRNFFTIFPEKGYLPPHEDIYF